MGHVLHIHCFDNSWTDIIDTLTTLHDNVKIVTSPILSESVFPKQDTLILSKAEKIPEFAGNDDVLYLFVSRGDSPKVYMSHNIVNIHIHTSLDKPIMPHHTILYNLNVRKTILTHQLSGCLPQDMLDVHEVFDVDKSLLHKTWLFMTPRSAAVIQLE